MRRHRVLIAGATGMVGSGPFRAGFPSGWPGGLSVGPQRNAGTARCIRIGGLSTEPATETAVAEATMTEPATVESVMAEAAVAEPAMVESVMTEAAVAEPATESAAVESATEPAVTEPAVETVTAEAAVESATMEPAAVESAVMAAAESAAETKVLCRGGSGAGMQQAGADQHDGTPESQ